MNWKAKAYLQKFLGWLPSGNKINYLFQKYVTKNLPVSDNIFFEKIVLAKYHYDNFIKYFKCDTEKKYLDKSIFYEFGAGWDLIIPITFYAMGINHQVLIDINKKLKYKLINNTLERFRTKTEKIIQIIGDYKNSLPDFYINNLENLKELTGVEYFAPMDASNTEFEDNTFDFISNTSTFEHIPVEYIHPIILECKRIMKPGAVMSCIIDLQDHYSYFDSEISVYNFLVYSESEWKKYNHPIQFQNRLRASDYIDYFQQTGLEILEIQKVMPDDSESKILGNLKLDGKFSGYDFDDLSVKVLKVILQKNNTV